MFELWVFEVRVSTSLQAPNSLDVLQALDGIYSAAFNNILVVLGLLIAIGGVLIPLTIAILQLRQQKREYKLARDELASEVESAITAAESRLKDEQEKSLEVFQEKTQKLIDDFKDDVKRKNAALEAGSFHVQALSAKMPVGKVVSAATAIPLYFSGQEHGNLRRVARILKSELAELNEAYFSRYKKVKSKCEEVIELLRSEAAGDHYDDLADEIERAYEDALKRIKPQDSDSETEAAHS